MRNRLGSAYEGDFGFGVEFDPEFAELAASPDHLAAVWNAAGEVVTASPSGSSRARCNKHGCCPPSF